MLELGDYRVTKLHLTNLRQNKEENKGRSLVHCQFLSWPDHGVPSSSIQILEFIELVRRYQQELLLKLENDQQKWTGHPLGPPICVHCSAGIGRTGTFQAIDISVNRLRASRSLQIEDTVNKIRLQRAQSVQMRDQYVFCYMAVLEYARREKLFQRPANDLVDLATVFEDFF